MADDITLPGTGSAVATEEIAARHFQRMKLALGNFDVDGGDVSLDNPMPVLDEKSVALLRQLVLLAQSPVAVDKAAQRQRSTAVIESGTVTTVTTVTTLTSVTNAVPVGNVATLGGADARSLAPNQNLSTWSACHRSRIS
jgi:hypothetical protein